MQRASGKNEKYSRSSPSKPTVPIRAGPGPLRYESFRDLSLVSDAPHLIYKMRHESRDKLLPKTLIQRSCTLNAPKDVLLPHSPRADCERNFPRDGRFFTGTFRINPLSLLILRKYMQQLRELRVLRNENGWRG